MNKKVLLLVLSLSVLVIIFLGFAITGLHTQPSNQPLPLVTPTPVIQPYTPNTNNKTLTVVQTKPLDGQVNIPVSQPMIVTFNRPFSLSEITFSLSPQIGFNTAITNNSLIIAPFSSFSPNTTYTLSINNGSTKQTFSFTTQQANPTPIDNAAQLNDDTNRTNYPDIFLYNRVPLKTADFSITGDFSPIPKDHYFFTVTLVNKTQGKQAFLNWLKSSGLTDQQIQTLSITYQ